MLNTELIFFSGFALFALQILCHPLSSSEDEIYIKSRLNNYRRRLLTLAEDVNPKYEVDLNSLIQQFDTTLGSTDVLKMSNLLENFMNQLDPDFSNYLQYELDVQHLDEDINIEIWFLEQLLQQIGNGDLAADIKHLLPYYEIAKNTRIIDKKYEIFSNIDNEISQRLLEFLEAKPVPTALLNVHLQLFREFLLYLLKQGNGDVRNFEDDIKNSLIDLEMALSDKGISNEEKEILLDRFDDVTSQFGKFLDVKIHEFETYKFG